MKPSTKDAINLVAILILIGCLSYFVAASLRYRFRHPEMTETRLHLHLFDSLRWRD